MFTQPCFIRKNTTELRKELEVLGYNRHPSYCDNVQYLYLNRGFYHTNVVGYTEEIERLIDCGTNEKLFLALASLRDDSDYMQWFTDGEIWVNLLDGYQHVPLVTHIRLKGHKATVQEIIEHFKK